MLVVGKPAHDRRSADIGQPQPVAEQRQQHFRIIETAAIEERKDEIRVGSRKKFGIAVGNDERHADAFEYLARLAVIDGMVAVIGMEAAGPFGMLGDEKKPLRVAEAIGKPGGFEVGRSHVGDPTTPRFHRNDHLMTGLKAKCQISVI